MDRAVNYVKKYASTPVILIIILIAIVAYQHIKYKGIGSFGPYVIADKTERTKLDELAQKINNFK